jgi:TetR/AcrR family transcriptional regulator
MGYRERQEQVIQVAAQVFALRGYHRASLREIARQADISLAGLYYYASSKQELLFWIVSHTLAAILTHLRRTLSPAGAPQEQLQDLVRHHLEFFTRHMSEMKVLSHDAELLEDRFKETVDQQKREYYRAILELLRALRPAGSEAELRVAALTLLGMINWIYTWYRPQLDPPAGEIARQMSAIFLHGFSAAALELPSAAAQFAAAPH